jgi:alkanesulfonate monooxygenase SsuD/methylene tetrahydromethanopterin reductase-like flavin-dependent oxidoreductase (luciferase family)
MLRFSNFLFPEARTPGDDYRVIQESLAEAKLCDALGVEVLWLAEHHFDGSCAYVDPVSFAGAVAGATDRIKIGFAVAQTSLHHPVRLAEQIAMLDNLTSGRLIVGLGRGTAYNVYEYQGYGIDAAEAGPRYAEAEQIMLRAWTSPDGFTHEGQFWQLRVPAMRPRCFTQPHPAVLRSASSVEGAMALAARGLPFMMNVQSLEETRRRLAAYRTALRETGLDEVSVAARLRDSWVWRNIVVADTDAEAERIAIPAFQAMVANRARMRARVMAEQGIDMGAQHGAPANADVNRGLIHGSPGKVAEAMAAIEAAGAGGVIGAFRLGPMPADITNHSLRLFMTQVAPQFSRVREPEMA